VSACAACGQAATCLAGFRPEARCPARLAQAVNPGLQVGDIVRCVFGDETRDGPIEHIRDDGRLSVRLSSGWLHRVDPDDVIPLPKLPSLAMLTHVRTGRALA